MAGKCPDNCALVNFEAVHSVLMHPCPFIRALSSVPFRHACIHALSSMPFHPCPFGMHASVPFHPCPFGMHASVPFRHACIHALSSVPFRHACIRALSACMHLCAADARQDAHVHAGPTTVSPREASMLRANYTHSVMLS